MQLEAARASWQQQPATAHGMIGQSLGSARAGLTEVRRALRELRVTVLDDVGLVLALRQLARNAVDRSGAELELDLPAEPLPLAASVEHGAYRVAQELARRRPSGGRLRAKPHDP